MMVAIHSADFIRRRATGEAHIVPGAHAFRSSRFSTTKPKPRASPVATTKYGRNGSNVVARPAPLRPRATAMSGPAQQSADATAAAIPPVAATTVLVVDVAMVFQCLQNRAVVGGPSGGTRHGQTLQRALHSSEIGDLLLDELNLLSGFPLHCVARCPVPDSEAEQFLDFIERETQLLRVLDEAKARDRVVRVLAVAGWRAPRGREQASPLVITDRLDVHVGRHGDLADGQWHALDPPIQYSDYTMYLGTWSRGRQGCPNRPSLRSWAGCILESTYESLGHPISRHVAADLPDVAGWPAAVVRPSPASNVVELRATNGVPSVWASCRGDNSRYPVR